MGCSFSPSQVHRCWVSRIPVRYSSVQFFLDQGPGFLKKTFTFQWDRDTDTPRLINIETEKNRPLKQKITFHTFVFRFHVDLMGSTPMMGVSKISGPASSLRFLYGISTHIYHQTWILRVWESTKTRCGVMKMRPLELARGHSSTKFNCQICVHRGH